MSSAGLQHYVVTLHYQENNLSDVQEITTAMVRGGYTTSLHDRDGKTHELSLNTFGTVSHKTPEEIKQEVAAAVESILGQTADVDVETLEVFLSR